MIEKLYKIVWNKIVEVNIIAQTDKYITIDNMYNKIHKEKDVVYLNQNYFKTYDDALNSIIKRVIENKEEINRLNDEINLIFSEYILNKEWLEKFKWLLF